MHRALVTMALVALLGLGAAAQQAKVPSAASLQKFVGDWQATFQGRPVVQLRIERDRGELRGTILHAADIETDAQGELTSARGLSRDVILEVSPSGDSLHLRTRALQTPGHSEYRMTITGDNAAELRLMTPQGGTHKPWKLVKIEGERL